LYLAHRVPYPLDKGDRIRTFHIIQFVARHARVHLACLADEPVRDDTVRALARHCERLAIVQLGPCRRRFRALASLLHGRSFTEGAFLSSEFAGLVRVWARQTYYGSIVASSSALTPYLELDELRPIPAVVDLMDVDSQKWLDYAAGCRGPRRWLFRTEGGRLRKFEAQLASTARAIVLVSEAEAAVYRDFCLNGTVEVIPNGVDLEFFRPAEEAEPPRCVFVGALDYHPNIQGIRWFCQQVWPVLHARRKSLVLSIVGRRPVAAVRRLSNMPGVEVIGDVPDLRPYLASATVSVVPLQIARGIQNKVLEALAMGKPLVASPQLLAGLPVQPGVHLLVASSPTQWVQAIETLLDDYRLRQRMQLAGRRHVEQHHHWDVCLERWRKLLLLPEQNGYGRTHGLQQTMLARAQ
jgi:sugar transferase (PEP-CTERM/EpsH1 system associated)